MTRKINRRRFLSTTAVGAAALSGVRGAEGSLPRRVLGKTGADVSILGFGGGSRFLMYEDEEVALEILNEAIDSGINYLDTAMSYGDGESETRYGKVLKHRRNEVWVTTKVPDRNYDDARRAIEASLKRLQIDSVDLLHIHSLGREEDLEQIESSHGVLKALYEARDEGLARYIGMTSHTDAQTMKTAIERHDLDCVMMALNAATNSGRATGFEAIALPAARKKNLGILAMKITGQERLVGQGRGKAEMRNLLSYSLSLPVASCVVGMPKPEFLRENIAIARGYSTPSEQEKERLRLQVEPSAASLDHFLRNHSDLARV